MSGRVRKVAGLRLVNLLQIQEQVSRRVSFSLISPQPWTRHQPIAFLERYFSPSFSFSLGFMTL